MRGIFAILAGLGVGAAVMYLFDPDRGNRRRALIRDKAVRLNRQTREAIGGTMKDLSNRAKGTMHEMKSGFSGQGDAELDRSQTNWSDGPAV
jgi:Gas vesicle protein